MGSTFANKTGDIVWKQKELWAILLGHDYMRGVGRKAGCYLVPSHTVSG